VPTRYDFFIVHAGPDQPAAQDLRQRLKARGHAAFVDADDVPAGAVWDAFIPEAQQHSRATIVLVSAQSGAGYYDKEEVATAIQLDRGGDHPVVPVVLDAVTVPEAMPYGLRRRVALFPERDGWPVVVDRLCALVGDFAAPASVRARLIELDKAIAKKPSNVEALRAERKALRQQMATGDTLEAGRIFAGRYELEALLGQGGFGQVWRAFDVDDSRFVALKILHRGLDQRRCDRFKTGIRKQKGLQHPHIAPVISGAHTDGHRTYAVLALLEGGDLARALEEGRLRAEQVPALITAIANALDCAHTAGVIHRDVKPSNLLLDERGVVHLTDFDLVRADDTGGESHTRGVGTVLYLAPEALDEHGKVTPATDQYALAMTAVCLLSGRSLPARTIYNRQGAVKALAVSDAARAVLVRGIADEPEERWPSIRGLAEALAGALAAESGPSRPAGTAAILAAPESTRAARTSAAAVPASAPVAPVVPILPGVVLVPIPGGTFMMGSRPGVGSDDERPQRQVTLSPFLMSATTVTQAQYQAVTGTNPSHFKGDDRPVEQVSWEDAVDFCNTLSRREGLQPAYDAQRTLLPNANGYRLPTEAQWEYACRAGNPSQWCFGDDEKKLSEYAWFGQNSGNETHPVGTKKPNAWGLYDMHGNVWEWCWDWSGTYPGVPQTEPIGAPRGDRRVVRGGACWVDAGRCRSAYRVWYHPGYRNGVLGFRLVRPAPPGR
jgi:formylglycine-generating enzyme required for sulfatase activity